MPIGVVLNADPVDTLPENLCRAFRRSQSFPILKNDYANGEQQRTLLALTSRKVWELQVALTAAQLTELCGFYEDHSGPHIPFTFHDFYEEGITGDYTVRFDGPWQQSVGIGSLAGSVAVRLVQLA